MNDIRPVTKADIPGLKKVLDSIELFPSDMLDDLIADYINNPESQDIWFTETADNLPISIAYCASEKMTEGTFNLYAIGVKTNKQGKGAVSRMMFFIENYLKQAGNRLLIVDTSGTDAFKLTRRFYEKLNYTREAVIRDFWKEGDDKVTFWKKLI